MTPTSHMYGRNLFLLKWMCMLSKQVDRDLNKSLIIFLINIYPMKMLTNEIKS